jgi:hypothetical protein
MSILIHANRRKICVQALTLFVGIALLSAGCASASYDIRIESTAKPHAKIVGTYRIIEPPVEKDYRPLYREALDLLRRALAHRGLKESPTVGGANLLMHVSLGSFISSAPPSPQPLPIYELIWTPVGSEQVQVGAAANGALSATIPVQPAPKKQLVDQLHHYRGSGGLRQHLSLRVFENRDHSGGITPSPIWIVHAARGYLDQDLQSILPFLMTASLASLGTSSDGPEIIRVKENDPRNAGLSNGK